MKTQTPSTLFALLLATLAFAAQLQASPESEIKAATQAWGDAFNSRQLENILSQYAPHAVFWGTGSQTLRDDPAEVRDYFKSTPDRPNVRVAIGEHRVRAFGDIGISTGFYTFSNSENGKATIKPARFSFVFQKQSNGEWKLVDHHSSTIPPL